MQSPVIGRRKWTGPTAVLCAGLFAVNALAWVWAWIDFRADAVLLGTALLAYAFGLRHAVDADHIAAIDNATRKLAEAGHRAIGTGLYFSLGHSTVVILAVVGIALFEGQLPAGLAAWQPVAGSIGTGISAMSLFGLAIANIVILVAVLRLYRAQRQGEAPPEAVLPSLLARRGLLARLLRGVFRLISKSWHMYPLGFLFGLGFDTASEIGLLAVSAAQAARGLPLHVILVFPVLFTAGMTLIDSVDGVLMAGAYRWATAEPLRKLRYNLVITLISVVVAVVIGGVELLGVADGDDGPANLFWRMVRSFNDHFTGVGVAVILLFAAAWLVSAVLSRRPSTGRAS